MRLIVKLPCLPAVALAALSFSGSAWAHNDVEFAAQGGVGFSNTIPADIGGTSGAVSVDPAPVYGALVGYRLEQDGFIFLSYSREDSTAFFRPKRAAEASNSRGISFDYLQFGGYIESWRRAFAPFFGFSVGVTRLTPAGGKSDFNFSAVVEAGVKYEIIRPLHLRLTGRLPLTFVHGESSAYCVGAGDCVATLSMDPLVQGQVLLGLGVGF